MDIKSNQLFGFILLSLFVMFQSCKGEDGYKKNEGEAKPDKYIATDGKFSKIGHVTFYIENSGSMFGYVNGATEFFEVVNKLAQYPNLIKDYVPFSYHMISGKANPDPEKNESILKIYNIGSDPDILKSKLTKNGLSSPSSGNSDLNEMFKITLSKAKKDSISILISDGIYDVGGNVNPLNSLRTEVQSTTTSFIQRLKTDDIETLLVKLESDFDGLYHPANVTDPTGTSVTINQKRPYYIWIFGNSELLNKYFPEGRIDQLNGYVDIARFRKLSEQQISYEAIGYENIGFRLDFNSNNTFELYKNVTNSSRFTFAVDLSSLKLSQSYLTTKSNYSCTGNYIVESINEITSNPPTKLKSYLKNLPFNATHIISISSSNHPEIGDLTISLNNLLPKWIEASSTDNDYPFDGSTTHTFGFKTLINGIEEAYKEIAKTDYLAQFKIKIKK